MSASSQSFSFVKYAGTYQLRIEEPSDLKAILDLDDPFWMATSAPIDQLRCDPVLLRFLDQDDDKRILSNDVRRAVRWLLDRLTMLDDAALNSDSLRIDHINSESEDGKKLVVAARRILSNTDMPEAKDITLSQVRDQKAFRSKGFFSGDGVIPATGLEDSELEQFVNDIVATMGAVKDVNECEGVNDEKLATFLDSAEKLLKWNEKSESGPDVCKTSLFPLGPDTSSAHDLLLKIQPGMEHFYRLCRLESVNRLHGIATPVPACPEEIMRNDAEIETFISESPIARPEPDPVLRLSEHLNPAFKEDLRRFNETVAKPLLGTRNDPEEISESDLQRINSAFTAYRDWLKAKPAGEVEKLGPEKLRAYLDGPLPERLRELILRDKEIGKELSAVKDLETLILLQRDLMDFCNNFVSFRDLYALDRTALFETGKVVMSGRMFRFNMKVKDPAAHSMLAARSGIHLLYSEVTGSKPEDKFFLMTPVTSETARRLEKERRGVFFDLNNREWDVRVISVVENPVSLRQAVVQPFIRIGNVISNSFQKLVKGTEQQLEGNVTKGFGQVETDIKTGVTQAQQPPAPVAAPPPPPGPPQKTSSARDWVLSGSIALAALGSSFAFITKTLAGVHFKSVLIAIGIGLAIVMVPIILIADFKLCRRNLGALLEASGWAVNAEMRLSRKLARLLAPKPKHPSGFLKLRRDRLGWSTIHHQR